MAKLQIKAGTLSYDLGLFAQDSSVTTGAGLGGLSYNSANLVAYYHRQNESNAVAITLASKIIGAWTSGGFVFVDNANMPGVCELGIPNAALATGAKWVIVELKGATNLAPVLFEIELTQTDNQDVTRFGMTALPNAAAEAAGGLYTRGAGAGQINQTVNGLINANIIDIVNAAVSTSLAQLGVNSVTVADKTNYGLAADQAVNVTKLDGAALSTHASGMIPADVRDIGGAAVSTSTAQLGVNAVNIGGSSQTGRDLGAGVIVTTNNDKMSYGVSVITDKTGYSLAPGQLLIKKNVALAGFVFVMTDSTNHAPAASLTVAATRSLDGGSFASCANSVAEIANGWYKIDLAAADLNATTVGLRFTASGADDLNLTLMTQA